MGLLSDYLPDWLPEDPQKQDAARMGLLNFGAQMLANSRQGLAPALGQGIVGGAKSYGDQLEQQQKMALQNLQTKNLGLDNRTKEMALGKQERIDQAYKQFYGKTAPVGQSSFPSAIPSAAPAVGASPDGFRQPMPNWMQQPGQAQPAQQPTQPGSPSSPSNDNYKKHLDFARYLESQGAGEEAQKYYDLAEKFKPKLKEQKVLRDRAGNIVTANVYEDGSTEVVPGFTPAEKLHFANTGGATLGLNQYTGKQESSAQNSQSPDSVATNATARRGQDKAQFHDGLWVSQPSAQNPTGTAVSPTNGPKVRDANDVLSLLDGIDPLLDASTGSYIGAGLDQGAQLFGASTPGAKAAAQLKVIGGALVSKMPKMSGPQSDKDVLLYKEMAGHIGDPTVPADIKRSAIETIKRLNKRYAEGNGGTPPEDAPERPKGLSAELPKANTSNKGKTALDHDTGKRYRSNGMQWVEVK